MAFNSIIQVIGHAQLALLALLLLALPLLLRLAALDEEATVQM